MTVLVFPIAAALGNFAPTRPQVEILGERLQSIVGEKNPYDSRPDIWREAVREIVDSPVTGQGPGNFRVTSAQASSESRTASARHAHSFLLTWAVESGIPAALLLIALTAHVIVLVRRARRRAVLEGRRQELGLLAGLAAAMTGVIGQGLIDYTLAHPSIFTTVIVVLGCLLVITGTRSAITS